MAVTVLTHNGKFHADEVVAISILSAFFKYDNIDISITRSRDEQSMKLGMFNYLIDVGGEYDPEKGKFDHHHKKMFRENGNIYASAGLIWKEFGKSFVLLIINKISHFASVDTDKFYSKVDTKLIDTVYRNVDELMTEVDAIDNGVEVKNKYGISRVVDVFNNIDVYSAAQDDVFVQVVNFMEQYLKNFVTKEIIRYIDEQEAKRELQKEIAVFNTFNSAWFGMVDNNTTAKLVIFPENKEKTKWRIQAVPEKAFSFVLKFPAPEEWRGKRDFIVDDVHVTFVHVNGFICGIKGSLKDAMKIAKKWIKLSK